MLATIVSLCLMDPFPSPAPAPPTAEDLARITARGRLLAGYDQAAWHASDALVKAKPVEGRFKGYIARKGAKGWVVSFGKLNEARDKYLVAYEAIQGDEPDRYTVRAIDPPRAEAGFERNAAVALETALADFVKALPARRPYNVAVLPAEGGGVWVYFVPAPTKVGVWPLGGDVRYRVGPDGEKILEKRLLHKSIIELERPKDGKNVMLMGMHTHVLDDRPEDTDVFHVLTRKPTVGEMIAGPTHAYTVEPDGSIKLLGKSEDVFKKK